MSELLKRDPISRRRIYENMRIVANKNITISISMKSSDIARVEKIRAVIQKKEGSLLSYSALIRRALFSFAEGMK